MSRVPLVAGNWKMFKTRSEARSTAERLAALVSGVSGVEIAVFPPFTALATVFEVLQDTAVGVGAQNVHWESEGAFTGEVSVPMLEECGCRYVVLGHSERRQLFGEDDAVVSRKVKSVLQSSLTPIVCVGESLQEREADRVDEVVLGQLEGSLSELTQEQLSRIIIAYEPVWAIGTGRMATPETAQEVHRLIRVWMASKTTETLGAAIRILYGGSVKPENTSDLMAQPDIDGALVGGASLDAESFSRIVKY